MSCGGDDGFNVDASAESRDLLSCKVACVLRGVHMRVSMNVCLLVSCYGIKGGGVKLAGEYPGAWSGCNSGYISLQESMEQVFACEYLHTLLCAKKWSWRVPLT